MTRVEICASDDFDTRERLLDILSEQGYLGNTDALDVPLGAGLSRFHKGETEISIFLDAWLVDLVGPPHAVEGIVAALTLADYQ